MISLLNRTAKSRFPVAAAALSCALLTLPAAAVAQEEDDATFEQKIIRGLLGGGQKNLEYRERSPLVIPPGRDLPPPDNAVSLQKSSAWPNDPDQRKRAASGGFAGADEAERASVRHSSPEELRRGTAAGRGRVERNAVTLSDNEASRPLRPDEMGDKNRSLFSMFGSKSTPQAETFKEEPVRSRMTEPPVGYRTPAPGQPYAAPKDSGSWFKLPDPFSRGTGDPK